MASSIWLLLLHWRLFIAVSIRHAWNPFVFEGELRWRLMVASTLSLVFQWFPIEEHSVGEVPLKLFIVHLDEYIIIPRLRLQCKRLMFTNLITAAIKSSRINLHILPLSAWSTLSLWIRSSCRCYYLILIGNECHLFEERFLLKMHLLATNA